MSLVPVSIIVEGLLDERILRQLIGQVAPHLSIKQCYGRQGRPWMSAKLRKFNHAAPFCPYVALADLEQDACPPALLASWLPNGRHSNLQVRIAVRMVESWLLADREACARFLSISPHHVPLFPEQETNAKQVMVNLARRSNSPVIRADMVPAQNSLGMVGRNYRGQLENFVVNHWQAERAQTHAPSLQRAINALRDFYPVASAR